MHKEYFSIVTIFRLNNPLFLIFYSAQEVYKNARSNQQEIEKLTHVRKSEEIKSLRDDRSLQPLSSNESLDPVVKLKENETAWDDINLQPSFSNESSNVRTNSQTRFPNERDLQIKSSNGQIGGQ